MTRGRVSFGLYVITAAVLCASWIGIVMALYLASQPLRGEPMPFSAALVLRVATAPVRSGVVGVLLMSGALALGWRLRARDVDPVSGVLLNLFAAALVCVIVWATVALLIVYLPIPVHRV